MDITVTGTIVNKPYKYLVVVNQSILQDLYITIRDVACRYSIRAYVDRHEGRRDGKEGNGVK